MNTKCASECVHEKKIKNSVGLIWVRRRHCIIIIIHICMCFELLTLILNRARVWECECVSKHTAIKGTLRKLWAHFINKYQSFLDMNNVWFFSTTTKKELSHTHARTHSTARRKVDFPFLLLTHPHKRLQSVKFVYVWVCVFSSFSSFSVQMPFSLLCHRIRCQCVCVHPTGSRLRRSEIE